MLQGVNVVYPDAKLHLGSHNFLALLWLNGILCQQTWFHVELPMPSHILQSIGYCQDKSVHIYECLTYLLESASMFLLIYFIHCIYHYWPCSVIYLIIYFLFKFFFSSYTHFSMYHSINLPRDYRWKITISWNLAQCIFSCCTRSMFYCGLSLSWNK